MDKTPNSLKCSNNSGRCSPVKSSKTPTFRKFLLSNISALVSKPTLIDESPDNSRVIVIR